MISLNFLASEETVTSPPLAASEPEMTHSNNASTAQQGTRKLLSSLRNLLDVSNKVWYCELLTLIEGQTKYSILYLYLQVLVKLVYKIFPWNRRARRRVLGDGEEDEL